MFVSLSNYAPLSYKETSEAMEFILYYRGELKANGGSADKHKLRQQFHPQLKALWEQLPFGEYKELLLRPRPQALDVCLLRAVGEFTFAPLVSESIYMVAELDILMLRPEPPGKIITQGGDIDNRIKTLLDALKIPDSNALPKDATPRNDENPFYCLLQDDKLITKLAVNTGQLLEPNVLRNEVVLMIHVQTKLLHIEYGDFVGLA